MVKLLSGLFLKIGFEDISGFGLSHDEGTSFIHIQASGVEVALDREAIKRAIMIMEASEARAVPDTDPAPAPEAVVETPPEQLQQ